MIFNVNDKVKVKLTPHGRAVHAADHITFWASIDGVITPPAYAPPREDAEGWSEWQLWSLMAAFGQHMGPGNDLCFETDIYL